MKAYFFLLFVCPVVVFAQNQQVPPSNGATDCPTFGKKNTSTKAGLFQYMRTNKPPKTEQQAVYRASALPTLKPTAEEEEAISLKKQKRAERAAARKERKTQTDPVFVKTTVDKPIMADEPSTAKAMADKPTVVKAMPDKPDETIADKPADAKAITDKEASIENESSAEPADTKTTTGKDASKRAEERDKKAKKAALKGKLQHIFKRTNKPSSRKNVQKCPQF